MMTRNDSTPASLNFHYIQGVMRGSGDKLDPKHRGRGARNSLLETQSGCESPFALENRFVDLAGRHLLFDGNSLL